MSPVPTNLHGAPRFVADASRPPDPSTVRRWGGRLLRLGTLLSAKLWQAVGWSAAISPTILAWDWIAIRRILPMEARSPWVVKLSTS